MIKQYKTIKRPLPDFYEYANERYFENLIDYVGQLKNTNLALTTIEIEAFDMFFYACFCVPNTPDARKYLTHSLDAGYAYTRLATEENLKLTFQIDAHQVELESAYEEDYLRIMGYWDERIHKALLLRHHDALGFLSKIDARVHIRGRNDGGDPALYLFAEIYKSLFSNRKYLGSLFYAAKRAFEPYRKVPSSYYRLLNNQIELIEAMLTGGNEVAFNAALEKALMTHRDYHANHDASNWRGVMALPLAAIAALAYDHYGYRVTVENEYLPQWIIDDRGDSAPWKLCEKTLENSPSARLDLKSADDERRFLQESNLDAQLAHIEERLDYLLRFEDPLEFIPAVFPHLWHIYLHKVDYRFSGDGAELQQYIQDNLPAIAEELDKERPNA